MAWMPACRQGCRCARLLCMGPGAACVYVWSRGLSQGAPWNAGVCLARACPEWDASTGHVAAVHKARADFCDSDPRCKADVQSSALVGRVHCVPGPLGTSEGRQGRQQTACDSGTKAVDP